MSTWKQHEENQVNSITDMWTPWEEYPGIQRGSIGWRMGGGESHIHLWWAFVRNIGLEQARGYLQAHLPAPMNWARSLGPWLLEREAFEEGQRAELEALGFVAPDAAHACFLALWEREPELRYTWTRNAPLSAARYSARSLWHVGRAGIEMPEALPRAWEPYREVLETGEPGDVDPEAGTDALLRGCLVGEVVGPWVLGCDPEEARDTYDTERMHYVDAFGMWMDVALDDREGLEALMQGAPESWRAWCEARFGW